MKNMDREIFRCNHLKHLYGQAIIVDSNNKYIERINMKTIEQGLNEAYEACGNNAYFGEGFKAGVEFAQQLYLIERDQYANIDDKQKQELIDNMPIIVPFVDFGEGFKAGVEFAEYCSLLEDPIRTHWSPIDIK